MPDGKVYNRQCNSYVHVFGTGFMGWLMSDGYAVYRRFQRRLCCWAHLIRKAEGLKYSLHAEARTFG